MQQIRSKRFTAPKDAADTVCSFTLGFVTFRFALIKNIYFDFECLGAYEIHHSVSFFLDPIHLTYGNDINVKEISKNNVLISFFL